MARRRDPLLASDENRAVKWVFISTAWYEPPRDDTPYPHARRFGAMAREALKTPVSPFVVAEQIREIVDGDSWRLRYLVGTDADGIWQRRQALSDEEWIALNAVDDEEWLARMKRERGLDIEL